MILFLWKDGNWKYFYGVQRASQLVLSDTLYSVCIARDALVDIYLFNKRCYVARGSVKLRRGGCARIYNLYTLPQERRKGYGKVILGKCIDIAGQNGYNRIDALIRIDNSASRKLHRKFKFRKMKHNDKKYRYYLEF